LRSSERWIARSARDATTGDFAVHTAGQETAAGTADVAVAWSGLTAGTKYLGRISYRDGSSEIGSTIVNVNS
jgi:hypothetical protein